MAKDFDHSTPMSDKCARITVSQDIKVPPGAVMNIKAKMSLPNLATSNDPWFVDNDLLKNKLMVPRMLIAESCDPIVQVCNATDAAIKIKAKSTLAVVKKITIDDCDKLLQNDRQLSVVNDDSTKNHETPGVLDIRRNNPLTPCTQNMNESVVDDVLCLNEVQLKMIDTMMNTTSPNFCQEDKQALRAMLTRNIDIFSEHQFHIGKANDFVASVRLKDPRVLPIPKGDKLRRYPEEMARKIDQYVDHSVKAGICEKADSSHACNVVCITKADGSLRLALDLRATNLVTADCMQPTSDAETVIHELRNVVTSRHVTSPKHFYRYQ